MVLNHQWSDTAGPISPVAEGALVAAWFEKRLTATLATPPRFREYAPLSDDPDYPAANYTVSYVTGTTMGIEYLDLRGWLSTRTIRCVAIDPAHPGFLKAYCNVRKTTRTFRLDRIISTTNLRTGSTAQSGGARVLFAPAYLRDDQACRAFVDLVASTSPGVFVLLSLAMRNGWLSSDARDVILDHALAEAEHRGLALPPRDLVALWLENLCPSKEAALDAVGRILADMDGLKRLLPRILEISRTFSSAAQDYDALVELVKALRSFFRRAPSAKAVDLIAWR